MQQVVCTHTPSVPFQRIREMIAILWVAITWQRREKLKFDDVIVWSVGHAFHCWFLVICPLETLSNVVLHKKEAKTLKNVLKKKSLAHSGSTLGCEILFNFIKLVKVDENNGRRRCMLLPNQQLIWSKVQIHQSFCIWSYIYSCTMYIAVNQIKNFFGLWSAKSTTPVSYHPPV